MPYFIKKCGDAYKVCLKRSIPATKGIPLENAIKQDETRRVSSLLSDYAKSPNFKSESFQKQLLSLGIPPEDYLLTVKHLASKYRYDPEKISFSLDGKHKLVYDSEKGPVKFGAVGYGDFLIWKFLEKRGKVEKGLADKKRDTFVKSHSAMGEKYDLGSLSPNTLAIRILWDHN